MSIQKRSQTTIEKSIQTNIENMNESLDSLSGPIYDIVVNPVATELASFEESMEYASMMFSLENASNLEPADVDALGENYGITRNLGTYAYGTVVFERTTPPTSDYIIPILTKVVVPNSELEYVTVASATMYRALASTYYNPNRNKYGVAIPVKATKTGKKYNTKRYTVTSISSTLANFTTCYNSTDIVGGKDIEINSSFANRIKATISGTDKMSLASVKGEIMDSYSSVMDVSVISFGDDLMTRTASGYPRDIYLIGGVDIEYSADWVYSSADDKFLLPKQPVSGVRGVYNSSTYTVYTEGVDWVLVQDMTDLKGSTQAQDSIQIPVGSTITDGDSLKIIYSQNMVIQNLQDSYDDNDIVGVDTSVFKGVEVPIYFGIKLSVLAGATTTTVQADIETYLESYIETYTFGDGLTQVNPSDVRLAILNNVNNISSLQFTYFGRNNTELEAYILDKNEYSILDSIVWTS